MSCENPPFHKKWKQSLDDCDNITEMYKSYKIKYQDIVGKLINLCINERIRNIIWKAYIERLAKKYINESSY